MSRLALRPTQPPIQRVAGALSLHVNGPKREAYRSSSINAAELAFASPVYLHGMYRNNFYSYGAMSGCATDFVSSYSKRLSTAYAEPFATSEPRRCSTLASF
jgi:hypothetical protein